MRIDDIEITDIYDNNHIDSHTPIIIITIPKRYLTFVYKNIYDVNIFKIHNHLESKLSFISLFFPIGQVQINDSEKYYDILLANKNIFPLSNKYKQIKKNIWIASLNELKSIGTIISKTEPEKSLPVFPKALLIKSNEYNYNIFSHSSYGNFAINKYLLGMNKNKVRMISINGDISSLNIPVSSDDIISDSIPNNHNFDKKVFFTTQGEIKMNSNCSHPYDNLSKLSQNECNAVTYNIEPMSNSQLDDNEIVSNLDMTYLRKSKNKKGRNVILRETDEPWFNDKDIMGDNHDHSQSHKITCLLDTKLDANVSILETLESDNNSINSPSLSDCVDDKVISYSQFDQLHKCYNGNSKNSDKYNSDGFIENFTNNSDEKYFDNNTIIILIILIIIIIILSCKS